jgi:protein SCO1/2
MLAPGLWALLLLPAADSSAPRLAVIRKAPDFVLTSQAEKPVRLRDLRGKVVLVSFVFTTCTGTCPQTTARLGGIADRLRRVGLKDDVHLVSITLDPRRDLPAVLRRYAELHEADPRQWTFLTGSPSEVARVLAAWDMWVKPTEEGQLDHPSRVYLIDPRGRVREIYSLEFLRPAWVVEDVRLLLRER